jgi:hypothetical protein
METISPNNTAFPVSLGSRSWQLLWSPTWKGCLCRCVMFLVYGGRIKLIL